MMTNGAKKVRGLLEGGEGRAGQAEGCKPPLVYF